MSEKIETTEALTPEQEKEQKDLESREAEQGFAKGFSNVNKEDPDKSSSTAEKSAAEREAEEAAKAETEAQAKADAEAKAKVDAEAKAEAEAKARAETDRKFIEGLPGRLRNLEGHIGGLTSKLDTALATAKAAAEKKGGDAPSEGQVQAALSNPEAWAELKKDFPDWAGPVEAELTAIRGELAKAKAPAVDLDGLKKEVAGSISSGIGEAEERAFIRLKHPTWKQTVKAPEFSSWLKDQPEDVKALSASRVADDAIKLLDTYEEHRRAVASSAESRLKQQKRLTGGLTPQGTPAAATTGISDEDAFNRGFKRGLGK